MFDWLFQGQAAIYVLLGLVALLLLAAWWQTRRRGVLLTVGVVLLLALLYWLGDVLVETDSEQLERKVQEMGQGLKDQNLDKVFNHVSESFRYNGADKKTMHRAADSAMRAFRIQNTQVWDIEVESIDRPGKKAVVSFSVKAETSVTQGQFGRCTSEWVLDPDGQWRMRTVELSDPVTNQKVPLPVR